MAVLTGPLALIRISGADQPVGSMKNITISEQFQVEDVRGIGFYETQELADTAFTGEATCESYSIDYYKVLNTLDGDGALLRTVESGQQFVDTLLLNNAGIDIDIYRKVAASRADNGAVTAGMELFLSLKGAKLTQDSITIAEGQISSRNSSFRFLSAIKRLV